MPSLVSKEVESFCRKNGIKHITSPPYHPPSNGQAENSVRTVKTGLKKMLDDKNNRNISLDRLLISFLYMNRNYIHSKTKKTPFEIVFGRKTELRWKRLQPNKCKIKTNINSKFQVNDLVYTRNYSTNKWQEGVVVDVLGKNTYNVSSYGSVWKRHSNQMTERIEEKKQKISKAGTSLAKLL